jgi:glycosidase
MNGNDGYYGPGSIMSTWIGNHDIPRAIHFASRQIGECWQGSDTGNAWTPDYSQPQDAAPYERLGLAFAVMMTNRGVPLIYYGDEIGLAGGGDPDDRRMLPWNDAQLNDHQLALREKVKALARIRGEHPILGRGVRKTLSSSTDTWVYEMGGCEGGDNITIAINRADTANSVSIPRPSYQDLVTGASEVGGNLMLPPRSFRILKAM